MDDMIIFDRVGFSYGRKRVIDSLSLCIKKCERICLFGPSGCGKTTLLRLICALESPDEGSVTVNGKTIRPVFQEDRLLPFLTVRQNCEMFGGERNIDEILSALGIIEAADEYPGHLSGGMARRAAIARALCGDGDIYIMDEPTSGLDEENAARTIDVINKYTAGSTFVCVLHDKEYAARLGCKTVDVSGRGRKEKAKAIV